MSRLLSEWFHDAASALLYTLAQPHAQDPRLQPPFNDLTRFVLEQHARMPDFLREPLRLATLALDAAALLFHGRPFHKLPPAARTRLVESCRRSPFGAPRELLRYFESLGVYKLYGRLESLSPQPSEPPANSSVPAPERIACEIAVVGSGPGGSITACLLAEAGRHVVLIEEGSHYPPDTIPPFSEMEMTRLYRGGGQTVALGRNKVAYVEGRCVGGGSEINSGLYHRTPAEVLEHWSRDFKLADATERDLLPHFAACEREFSVSLLPYPAPPASLKLPEGANRLGWRSLEVPRWFKYVAGRGQRQSMTRTCIPRFLHAGGSLIPDTRVLRIRTGGGRWHLEARQATGRRLEIECERLFLAGGAVQTPALLRRSGLTRNIGNQLRLHPTVKVVARFPEPVNAPDMGVPVHQVKEFAPSLSFGCSISTPPYLALGLLRHATDLHLPATWPHLANFYAMSAGPSTGTVRTLPGCAAPLVRYHLHPAERANLTRGLRLLCQALLAAGATELFPATEPHLRLQHEPDLRQLPEILADGTAQLMTIHLFSSCPMGEDRQRTATDSFGRVHGFSNLFIADASLLCTPPTVNPQGTIMAFARRNALHFLGQL